MRRQLFYMCPQKERALSDVFKRRSQLRYRTDLLSLELACNFLGSNVASD